MLQSSNELAAHPCRKSPGLRERSLTYIEARQECVDGHAGSGLLQPVAKQTYMAPGSCRIEPAVGHHRPKTPPDRVRKDYFRPALNAGEGNSGEELQFTMGSRDTRIKGSLMRPFA